MKINDSLLVSPLSHAFYTFYKEASIEGAMFCMFVTYGKSIDRNLIEL